MEEHFAQKFARRFADALTEAKNFASDGPVQFSDDPEALKTGGTLPSLTGEERRKFYYYTRREDWTPDSQHSQYAVQHVWAGPDDTGWATAAQQLLKVSRSARFVAWLDSGKGVEITAREGAKIRTSMLNRVVEEVNELFPERGIDYGKDFTLPYLDTHVIRRNVEGVLITHKAHLWYVDTSGQLIGREYWLHTYSYNDWIPDFAQIVDEVLNFSRSNYFDRWCYSQKGKAYFERNEADLRAKYDQQVLEDAFGWDVAGVPVEASTCATTVYLSYRTTKVTRRGLTSVTDDTGSFAVVGGEQFAQELEHITTAMASKEFSHWLYTSESEAYFMRHKDLIPEAQYRRIIASMYASVGA
jgi:hypothetical protein